MHIVRWLLRSVSILSLRLPDVEQHPAVLDESTLGERLGQRVGDIVVGFDPDDAGNDGDAREGRQADGGREDHGRQYETVQEEGVGLAHVELGGGAGGARWHEGGKGYRDGGEHARKERSGDCRDREFGLEDGPLPREGASGSGFDTNHR